jgi:energy-coupling factor transport system substrate-specific component
MDKRLNAKDLITVGVYTALYLVTAFAIGMLTCVPVLYPALYFLWPFITGIPFMLFLTKVEKFGMVTIMAIISGVFWFTMGYTWLPVAGYFVCGLLADLIFKSGHYKNFKTNLFGYWTYSLSIISMQLPMWLKAEEYIAGVREMMGDQYTDQLVHYMPSWMGFAAIGIIFIGSVSGALLGRKMLRKHFERAGIA